MASPRPLRIAPSLLAADFGRLAEHLRLAEEGGADLHHVDVMDGHFVPNLSIGPPVVKAVARTARIPLDCHLMVTDPVTFGKRFAKLGAWGVTFHIEVAGDPRRTAETLRALGVRVGVAINPPTPVERLEPALPHVDMVLVMSVNPGFGGQAFLPEVLAKVEALRGRLDFQGDVEMDGGIGPDNVAACAAAGANVLVAGTAVYGDGTTDVGAAIRELRARAERAVAVRGT